MDAPHSDDGCSRTEPWGPGYSVYCFDSGSFHRSTHQSPGVWTPKPPTWVSVVGTSLREEV